MTEPTMRQTSRPTIGVVIPTLNAAATLPRTLAALKEGPVAEIVVADGGSADTTAAIARAAGARVIEAPRGRGPQLAAGAAEIRGDWLLFLHADPVPAAGWSVVAGAFMARPGNRERAAAFHFALDDESAGARRLERMVAWRNRAFGLAYGDQGLLIARDFYRSLGGFRPLPLMEDVDLVWRIGRRRLAILDAPALTSAARWRRQGWILRSARNAFCLMLWFAGVPARLIARIY